VVVPVEEDHWHDTRPAKRHQMTIDHDSEAHTSSDLLLALPAPLSTESGEPAPSHTGPLNFNDISMRADNISETLSTELTDTRSELSEVISSAGLNATNMASPIQHENGSDQPDKQAAESQEVSSDHPVTMAQGRIIPVRAPLMATKRAPPASASSASPVATTAARSESDGLVASDATTHQENFMNEHPNLAAATSPHDSERKTTAARVPKVKMDTVKVSERYKPDGRITKQLVFMEEFMERHPDGLYATYLAEFKALDKEETDRLQVECERRRATKKAGTASKKRSTAVAKAS